MPDIIIPRGHARDGWIWTCVNGNVQWIKAGELTTIDSSHAEVLINAMIPFETITTGSDVPDGATAHFSFAQGVYWTQAEGDLTAADILSSTTSIEDGVGYTGEDGVTMMPAALAALSTDMTVVMRGRLILTGAGDDTSSLQAIINFADSEDYTFAGFIGLRLFNEPSTQTFGAGSAVDLYDESTEKLLSGTLRTVTAETEIRIDTAQTVTISELAASMMGDPVDTLAASLTTFTVGHVDMITATTLSNLSMQLTIESITVYPAQDDSALPALSTPL